MVLLTSNSAEGDGGVGVIRHSENPTLVINELLTYVCSCSNHSSWDMVEEIVSIFYSDKEIIDAGKLFKEHVLPMFPDLRVTRVTDAKAVLQTIINAFSKSVENDIEIPVKFCAVNVKKLPRVEPELINRESMATQILALQKQMQDMVEKVHANIISINSINLNSQTTYSAMVSQPVGPAPKSVANASTSQSRPPGINPGLNVPSLAADMSNRNQQRAAGGSPLVAHVISAPTVSADEWEKQKHERRRELKEKLKTAQSSARTLIGSSSGGSVKGSYPAKVVHVGNVDKDVTETILMDHLKSLDIYVFNVRTVSHKDSYRKSFRVIFKEADLGKVMSSETWGEGISVREWISNRE